MITPELISYIRKQIKNNVSSDITISKLIKAGWHKEDIDEGFLNVNLELKPEPHISENKKEVENIDITKNKKITLDRYREPVNEDNILDLDVKIEEPKIETPKIEVPIKESALAEVIKEEAPVVETPKIESTKEEAPIIETPKIEEPVVAMPEIKIPEAETYDIEIPSIEIPDAKEDEVKIPAEVSIVAIPEIIIPKTENNNIEIPSLEIPAAKEDEIKIPAEVSSVATPDVIIPKTENHNIEIQELELPFSKEVKIEAPVKEEVKIEPVKIEEAETKAPQVETPVMDNFKIWTPKKAQIIDGSLDIKKDETDLTIQNPELPIVTEQKIELAPTVETKLIQPEEDTNTEELIPTLVPKVSPGSFYAVNKVEMPKDETPVATTETSKNLLFNNLPKTAMLSSYENDFSNANKDIVPTLKSRGIKLLKWLVAILIVVIIGSAVWAFATGRISLDNIPFIKKDPRILLLNNSKVLASLNSYKTDTFIEISSPSFANISSGLIMGEAIASPDKDYFSINTQGQINKDEKGLFSSNYTTVKSSLLLDELTLDIKNNNSELFLTASDLSQIIKESDSEPLTIKINEEEFNSIPALFPEGVEVELNKISLYKLLSNGMSSYINNDTLSVYDDFINSVYITEKGEENIKGIDTYHYSINTDRQLIKKLLTKVAEDFTLNLSTEDKDKLTEILGSVSVESFEIWVGKGDNNIYQRSVVLNVPLSKILSFEDKSIGDNQVTLSWKTTYYDFNISNDINIPETSTPAVDFIKTIKETKIKNSAAEIKQLATDLFNAEGTYGKISNLKGSCMSPVSGSLFSPLGHTKGAGTAISAISELLNNVLETTNNEGYCYSTPKTWSFTIPVSDNYDIANIPEGGYQSFFCIDNTGSTKNLIIPPTGVVCE
ncbi:MAG: hypothetical protein JJE53_01480 [Candidatus Pacebacteria bacterium]|nr:hypothetical protein [Candidatus Paceibacterota bacterium]